jgi:hypothetical protein
LSSTPPLCAELDTELIKTEPLASVSETPPESSRSPPRPSTDEPPLTVTTPPWADDFVLEPPTIDTLPAGTTPLLDAAPVIETVPDDVVPSPAAITTSPEDPLLPSPLRKYALPPTGPFPALNLSAPPSVDSLAVLWPAWTVTDAPSMPEPDAIITSPATPEALLPLPTNTEPVEEPLEEPL